LGEVKKIERELEMFAKNREGVAMHKINTHVDREN